MGIHKTEGASAASLWAPKIDPPSLGHFRTSFSTLPSVAASVVGQSATRTDRLPIHRYFFTTHTALPTWRTSTRNSSSCCAKCSTASITTRKAAFRRPWCRPSSPSWATVSTLNCSSPSSQKSMPTVISIKIVLHPKENKKKRNEYYKIN